MAENKLRFICSILLTFFQLGVQQDPRLESLAPLASNIGSISGFSTGGGISLQFYLSHSSNLRGCGIFSGPIYECGFSEISEKDRVSQCTGGKFEYYKVVARIYERALEGLFDPLMNIARQKQYVSQGALDPVVNIKNDRSIHRFFSSIGTTSVYYNETQSGHGYPTENCGTPCQQLSPLTTDGCTACSWSGAFESLNYIYGGDLQPPMMNNSLNSCSLPDDNVTVRSDKLNMANTGYIYVPANCKPDASSCTLHAHFHGCWENAEAIGTDFIKCGGVMDVAEANDIVVLFPQTTTSNTSKSAAIGCWDYTGYTGPLYGTKRGPQIVAIRKMMERVMGSSFQ